MRCINTNPIILRELIHALRLPRGFVSLGLVLIVALAFFCFNYYAGVHSRDLTQFSGRDIFFPIVYILCLVAFPLAITSASSIVGEREEDTLELLLTTPIHSFSIIWGKFVANFITSLNYLIVILPFLSICMVIGGLSPSDMKQSLAVILGFYGLAVSTGIMVSLFSKTSASAGRVAVWFMLVFLLGPYVIRVAWWLILQNFYGHNVTLQNRFGIELLFNPFVAITFLYSSVMSQSIPTLSSNPLLQNLSQTPGYLSLILNLLLSMGLLAFTSLLFHYFSPFFTNQYSMRNLFAFRRKGKKNPVEGKKKRGWLTFDGFSSSYKKIIFEKESLAYNRKISTHDWTVISFSGLIAVAITSFLWFSYPHDFKGDFIHVRIVTGVVCMTITLLFSHIPASQSIYSEHRRATWPVLRTTTIPSIAIIRGKRLAHFRQAALPIVAFSIVYYLVNWCFTLMAGVPIKNYEFWPMVYTLCFIVICLFFYTSIGVLYSSKTSPHQKSNPGHKTFTVVMFHAFLPYLLTILGTMFFFVILPRMGGAQNVIFMEEKWKTFFMSLSPCYILNPQKWVLREYIIFTLHGLILLGLGYILQWSATAEIRKGKE